MSPPDDTGANLPDLSPPTRFFLRVACIDDHAVLSHGERALYTTIGFFICFFGAYASTAFLALLSRAGGIQVSRLDTRTLVAILASTLVALAFMMFDRSLVAYVDADLDSLDTTSNSLLHPVAKRNLRLFFGRLAVALLISLFATQSVELLLFSADIRQERGAEALTHAKDELAAARSAQTAAQESSTAKQSSLLKAAKETRYLAYLASLGQHHHCYPNTECSKRRKASGRAFGEYRELGPGPLTADSQYERAVRQAAQKVEKLHDNPDRGSSGKGPLQDVTALYHYLGRHTLARFYYAATVLILIAIDLAALLLKYFVAHNSEYEHNQAALQQVRWRQTAEDLQDSMERRHLAVEEAADQNRRDTEVRQSKAELSQKAELAELEILKAAYENASDDSQLADSAERVAQTHIADNLGRVSSRTRPHSWGSGSTHSNGGNSENAVATDTEPEGRLDNGSLGSLPTAEQGTALDSSLVLEILGVTAGISALVYLLGGVYAYGQFKQASLPTSALAAVSTRVIVLHGVLIAAIGLPMVLGLSSTMETVFIKLQRSVRPDEAQLSGIWEGFRLTWEYLKGWLRNLGRPTHRTSGKTGAQHSATERDSQASSKALTLRSPQVLGGTVAATAMVGATEITDSSAAIIAGATSLGTVVVGLGFLAVLGLVRPKSRGFRGAMLLMAAAGTMLGTYWIAQRQPLELPEATAKLVNHRTCLQGPFLDQDSSTAYLIDGHTRTLRLIPQRAIADIAVDGHAKPVISPIKTVPCPATLRDQH